MKLIGLIGSLRQNSYHRMLFSHYKKIIQDQADLIEGIHHDFPLYNDDLREKGPPETVLRLYRNIKDADGILFFSPEYNYSLPGVLKNTIDWMSKLPEQPFAAKPVAIISASPGKLGGARMQYHLRQVGVFLDMRFLNRPEVMISEVHKKISPNGEITDPETLQFLKTHFEHFLKFMKSINP